jgi:hypothetical protein
MANSFSKGNEGTAENEPCSLRSNEKKMFNRKSTAQSMSSQDVAMEWLRRGMGANTGGLSAERASRCVRGNDSEKRETDEGYWTYPTTVLLVDD